MADRAFIQNTVNGYLEKRAPVLFFTLSFEGKILLANRYATQLMGSELTGESFYEVIADFSGEFDLMAAANDSSKEAMLTVGPKESLSQTFYFTFNKTTDGILAFGRLDTDEIEIMRKEVLLLNQEQSNLMRKLHKTNAQLLNKEKALTNSISELKMAQSKLVASEKMASLGRLVAGFAHEINTPIGIALTASSGILESSQQIEKMLTQDEVDEEELISTLETIRDASKLVVSNLNRSADLVTSFKRTSVDQSIENRLVYCLEDAIEDALTSMRIKIKNKSVTASFKSNGPISLYGNPGDMIQIISNLFDNSLLHGFENGALKGDITIDITKENETVLIRYSDTGRGMSTETAERIFEPFYTTLRARGGTGLGMYICHNIVTSRLNGTIACKSEEGKGTHFLITVPIKKEENHEADKIQE